MLAKMVYLIPDEDGVTFRRASRARREGRVFKWLPCSFGSDIERAFREDVVLSPPPIPARWKR